MRKTTEHQTQNQLTVDLQGLMALTCLGRASAEKIGQEAGAALNVGRRKLYIVSRVARYMETLADEA